MAKSANLYIRVDPQTKKDAEELFKNFGITISDAVTIFLRQSIMAGGMPFEVKLPQDKVKEARGTGHSLLGPIFQAQGMPEPAKIKEYTHPLPSNQLFSIFKEKK